MPDVTDFIKFYDLERYLFNEVGPRFRSSGVIEPVDLFHDLCLEDKPCENYN